MTQARALLVGLAYPYELYNDGSDGDRRPSRDPYMCPIPGAYDDVDKVKHLLINKYNYQPENITILLDDGDGPQPTKNLILAELRKLRKGVKDGDRLFFHFSGHGDQQPNLNGLEPDGQDELLCMPYYRFSPPHQDTAQDETSHQHSLAMHRLNNERESIKDDTLKKVLVDGLPSGVRLTVVVDACHAGTILDLPHYHCNRTYVPWIKSNTRFKSSQPTSTRVCGPDRRLSVPISVLSSTSSSMSLPDIDKRKRLSQNSVPSASASVSLQDMQDREDSISKPVSAAVEPPVSTSEQQTPAPLNSSAKALRFSRKIMGKVSAWVKPLRKLRIALRLARSTKPAVQEPEAEPAREHPLNLPPLALHDSPRPIPRVLDVEPSIRPRLISQTSSSSDVPWLGDSASARLKRCSSCWSLPGSHGSEDHLADVTSWCSSLDHQRSFGMDNGGLMVSALVDVLTNLTNPTYREVITRVNHKLYRNAVIQSQNCQIIPRFEQLPPPHNASDNNLSVIPEVEVETTDEQASEYGLASPFSEKSKATTGHTTPASVNLPPPEPVSEQDVYEKIMYSKKEIQEWHDQEAILGSLKALDLDSIVEI